MSYKISYTAEARNDVKRLLAFLVKQDLAAAHHARAAIQQAATLLQTFPFSCRKASEENPFLRELLIPFGSAGYVALFEIEDSGTVTILAVRHQREEDFH